MPKYDIPKMYLMPRSLITGIIEISCEIQPINLIFETALDNTSLQVQPYMYIDLVVKFVLCTLQTELHLQWSNSMLRQITFSFTFISKLFTASFLLIQSCIGQEVTVKGPVFSWVLLSRTDLFFMVTVSTIQSLYFTAQLNFVQLIMDYKPLPSCSV